MNNSNDNNKVLALDANEVEKIWQTELITGSNNSISTNTVDNQENLCTYEKERLAQIKKNKEMIASLGLDNPLIIINTNNNNQIIKRKRKKKKKIINSLEMLANRTDSRKR